MIEMIPSLFLAADLDPSVVPSANQSARGSLATIYVHVYILKLEFCVKQSDGWVGGVTYFVSVRVGLSKPGRFESENR